MSTGKKVAALGWKPLNFAVSGATLLALRSQLGNGHKPLSDILIRDLTAHRTLGLRLALNEQPEVAIVAVTHALSAQIFYRGADAYVLDIRPVSTVLASHADGIEDTKAGKAWADRHARWAAQMPRNVSALLVMPARQWCGRRNLSALITSIPCCDLEIPCSYA